MRGIFGFFAAIAIAMGTPAQSGEPGGETEPGLQRIVAVGDLHGDFDAWEEIAIAAGVADREGEWIGGEAILVQLGDITDRGPDSLKIIRYLQKLDDSAQDSGGDVVVLLGNHEAMNVTGDLRYVHPGEYDSFRDRRSEARREATWKANRERIEAFYLAENPELMPEQMKQKWFDETPLGMLAHRRAWRPGGELGEWAAGLQAVAKIGSTLFVHGGLSEEATREPIDAVNQRHSSALQPGSEIERTILTDPLGPLWYRGNVRRELTPEDEGDPVAARPGRDEEIAIVLARYGAKRLVVAHTPSLEGIVTDLDHRLVRIDTGISSYYGGPASFLEIVGDRVTAYSREDGGDWSATVLGGPEQGEPD